MEDSTPLMEFRYPYSQRTPPLPDQRTNPRGKALSVTQKSSRNVPVFPRLKQLGQWLPMLDPHSPEAEKYPSSFSTSKRSCMLYLQLSISLLVLVINMTWTLLATNYYGLQNGVGTIFHGNCETARDLNVAIHLVINILSTLLLGSSNFCTQILAAPTRKEAVRAHRNGDWLDIGIQSIRNLWKIRGNRVAAWLLLAVSSGVLHLLWNSAVFPTFPFVRYTTVFVTNEAFNNTQPWNTSDPVVNQIFENNLSDKYKYDILEREDCVKLYVNATSGAGNVVVVTELHNNSLASNDGSAFIKSFSLPTGSDWTDLPSWMCQAEPEPASKWCTPENMTPLASNWTVLVGNEKVRVDYCLSQGQQEMDDWCELHFAYYLMLTVCCMNGLKVLGILYTIIHTLIRAQSQGGSLVTTGDAVASFLEKPDLSTENNRIASAQSYKRGLWGPLTSAWQRRRVRRLALVNRKAWYATMGMCFAVIIAASAQLGATLKSQDHHGEGIDVGAILGRGLGKASPADIAGIFLTPGSSQLWYAVLFANAWQLGISILYAFVNSLVTTFCVIAAWNRFGMGKKFLRLSFPRGLQRGSYFLSLPLKYGIPLTGAMVLLHWLISQSVFVAQAAAYDFSGNRLRTWDASRVGYSTLGILLSLVFGLAFVIAIIVLSLWRITLRVPPAGTCSAAISAACHRHYDDEDAHLLPVQWGVVDAIDGIEYYTFTTSKEVRDPELKTGYL